MPTPYDTDPISARLRFATRTRIERLRRILTVLLAHLRVFPALFDHRYYIYHISRVRQRLTTVIESERVIVEEIGGWEEYEEGGRVGRLLDEWERWEVAMTVDMDCALRWEHEEPVGGVGILGDGKD